MSEMNYVIGEQGSGKPPKKSKRRIFHNGGRRFGPETKIELLIDHTSAIPKPEAETQDVKHKDNAGN